METKITVRVPETLVQGAKRYAERNGATLTRLITAYLQKITAESETADAPITERLTGVMSQKVTVQD